MNKQQVYILRGLPGSGKSTWAEQQKEKNRDKRVAIVSADRYHINADGKYEYKKENAHEAHKKCFSQFVLEVFLPTFCDNLQNRKADTVIVDNTNTTLMEISPYLRIAELAHCDITICEFICPLWVSKLRNSHQVPDATINHMNENLLTQVVPVYWKVATIYIDSLKDMKPQS